MELCKVGGIQGLISKHAVNGEILDRTELLLVKELEGRTFQPFSEDYNCVMILGLHNVNNLHTIKMDLKEI